MSAVNIFVVKYLEPAEALVAAVDAKTAVEVFLARASCPRGAVIQGAYRAHGDVPTEFVVPPPEAA
jgi:hypothetical protein